MDSHDTISDFINQNSKFFTLPEGEEKEVYYKGAETVPNRFDGGKTFCIRYIFECNGVTQCWDRGSRALAEQMLNIPIDSRIAIRKTGSGNQTKYFVRRVDEV